MDPEERGVDPEERGVDPRGVNPKEEGAGGESGWKGS